MAQVQLKDGTGAESAAVTSVMMAITQVFNTDPGSFIELVELARNPNYQIMSSAAVERLKRDRLVEDGKIHPFTKQVILCAVPGGRYDLGSPLK